MRLLSWTLRSGSEQEVNTKYRQLFDIDVESTDSGTYICCI
jgi:hypothetical protein